MHRISPALTCLSILAAIIVAASLPFPAYGQLSSSAMDSRYGIVLYHHVVMDQYDDPVRSAFDEAGLWRSYTFTPPPVGTYEFDRTTASPSSDADAFFTGAYVYRLMRPWWGVGLDVSRTPHGPSGRGQTWNRERPDQQYPEGLIEAEVETDFWTFAPTLVLVGSLGERPWAHLVLGPALHVVGLDRRAGFLQADEHLAYGSDSKTMLVLGATASLNLSLLRVSTFGDKTLDVGLRGRFSFMRFDLGAVGEDEQRLDLGTLRMRQRSIGLHVGLLL